MKNLLNIYSMITSYLNLIFFKKYLKNYLYYVMKINLVTYTLHILKTLIKILLVRLIDNIMKL